MKKDYRCSYKNMSFESQQKLEQLIVNDTSPQLSTVDVLSSLKLIGHFEDPANQKGPTGKIAQEELKYLQAGMLALEANPALSGKFGKGFSGAMAVAGLLKQVQARRTFDSIMDGVLEANAATQISTMLGELTRETGLCFQLNRL